MADQAAVLVAPVTRAASIQRVSFGNGACEPSCHIKNEVSPKTAGPPPTARETDHGRLLCFMTTGGRVMSALKFADAQWDASLEQF